MPRRGRSRHPLDRQVQTEPNDSPETGNVTSNHVRVETRASVDVVGRTNDKGEKEVLSQRWVLDRAEMF